MACTPIHSGFAGNRDGSMGVVLALFLTVAASACALAIDMGALYLERRTLQGVSDIAAVAAASDLARAEEAVQATLAANGFSDVRTLAVVKGRYAADPAVAHGQRFVADLEPFNAVRLHVAAPGRLYFAKSILTEPEISVTAIGRAEAQATFSIGSRLAAVQGGLANAVLGALLGGNVSLTAMDYNALLGAQVSLLDFLSALATEVGVTAGSFSDVLNAQATVGDVLKAAAKAATAGGEAHAAQAITTLLGQSNAGAPVALASLVSLGPLAHADVGQPHAGLASEVNVMSLVTALATLANGNSQVAVNLGAAVPGLLSLTLDLAVGEPMQHSGWLTVGQAGATVHTAQTRLRLVAEVGGSGLLAGIRVRLPLYVELASAEARLKDVSCQGADIATAAAQIEGRPAVVRAWIGDVAPGGLSSFGSSVPVSTGSIVNAPLVRVTGSAYTEMTQASADVLRFTQSDVAGHVVKTVSVRDHLSSLTSSLLSTLNLKVDILGLGLGLSAGAVKGLVVAALTPVTALLDSLIEPLLALAGVRLGEADIEAHGLRCGRAVLAG